MNTRKEKLILEFLSCPEKFDNCIALAGIFSKDQLSAQFIISPDDFRGRRFDFILWRKGVAKDERATALACLI